MQLTIATRHGHIGENTQAKVRAKVEKLTRIYDRLSSAEVTLDLANENRPRVEVQVNASKGGPFVASESADQLLGALDAVVHKLERQLRKHKDKLTDHGNQVSLGRVDNMQPTEPE